MAFFLKTDLAIVEATIQETIEKLRETGAELRNAVTQSSETWHDNFPFENAQQQARLLEQRLKDLEQIRRNATIVEMPKTNMTVAIGHTVTIKNTETNEVKKYKIGSHITFTKDAISYASPIGALLLGKKVGQRTKGTLGKSLQEFEIIEISGAD